MAILSVALLASCQFDVAGLDLLANDGGADDPDAFTLDARSPGSVDAARDPLPDAEPVPASPDAAPSSTGCPAGYLHDPGTQTSYRVSSAPARWHAAEADCENDGVATHLATITDPNELSYTSGLAGTGSLWVGLSDTVEEGVFRFVVGWIADFRPWRPGEPDDDGRDREDCVSLAAGGYADEDCESLRRYLCECDGWPPVPSAYE